MAYQVTIISGVTKSDGRSVVLIDTDGTGLLWAHENLRPFDTKEVTNYTADDVIMVNLSSPITPKLVDQMEERLHIIETLLGDVRVIIQDAYKSHKACTEELMALSAELEYPEA